MTVTGATRTVLVVVLVLVLAIAAAVLELVVVLLRTWGQPLLLLALLLLLGLLNAMIIARASIAREKPGPPARGERKRERSGAAQGSTTLQGKSKKKV